MQDHTNENLPSDLKVKRQGDKLILFTRTATITIPINRGPEVAAAITEVSS